MNPFEHHARVLFVHAHPDDETLSTGALIAELAASGVEVSVLTATRGERGEVRPELLADLRGAALAAHRASELEAACRELGVAARAFLGEGLARRPDWGERLYRDSGMVWLDAAETLAGPAPDAGAEALSLADQEELTLDIAAYLEAVGASLVVTYDAMGGYGHPDHVALHQPTRAAAQRVGVRFAEVVSQPRGGAADGDAFWFDLSHRADAVVRALRCYGSQLTVDGADVVHVGGQREPICVRVGVR